MNLTKQILSKGYKLFLDKWYHQPELFETLRKRFTNVNGTVRKKSQNYARLETKKSESCTGILSFTCCDKKDVHVVSKKHSEIQINGGHRKKQEKLKKEDENVIKPYCIKDCNFEMGWVDRQYQKYKAYSFH